jgi:hypothetical protein
MFVGGPVHPLTGRRKRMKKRRKKKTLPRLTMTNST